jgi:hypothetical protein
MASSAVQLCARALIALGAQPIASFQETTPEALVCRTLYGGLRDALLSAHPWSFATAQARLPRLAAQPVADFAHAFQLPPDFLRALSAGTATRGRGIAYRIAERRVHADVDQLVLTYLYRPRARRTSRRSSTRPWWPDWRRSSACRSPRAPAGRRRWAGSRSRRISAPARSTRSRKRPRRSRTSR